MINVFEDFPLIACNTFGVSSTASVFVESDDVAELTDYVRSLSEPLDALLLGSGSNILFVSDRCNTVIHPVIKGIEVIGETSENILVRVGAGEIWDDFVSWCVDRNFSGVENLSHIPGTVGACPIQNIGAYGVEAKDTIEKVEAIGMTTGEAVVFEKAQCLFDYRDSFFKKNKGKYLITAVQFRLSKNFSPDLKYADLKVELSRDEDITVKKIRQTIINIRSRKLPDPSKYGNAGSFFKNPAIDYEKSEEIEKNFHPAPLYPVSHHIYKIPAAWLIHQCGWKGVREGNVGTHDMQPLVIVNYGGATGKEVLSFANKITDSVLEKFGIALEKEVNIV